MIPTAIPMSGPAHPASASSGGRLVPTPAGAVALRGAALRVDAAAGIARVVLEQTFTNGHEEPLRVVYRLPLPADAAVSGFAFRIAERRIVGTIDEVRKARETFERAIAEGRTAALLEEETSSLFTQELGNVPPGATIVAEITIDQPLAWIAGEGAWEWRFPLAAAPRYLGAGADPAGALDVALGVLSPRASLTLTVRDAVLAGRSPESPSHAIQVAPDGSAVRVALGGGGQAPLDRDLVVRWPAALEVASAVIDAARVDALGEACGILTVIPPAAVGRGDAVARDLVLLLDTSGSMDGEPLAQAKRVASALVASLGDGDTLELVEFSTATRRFGPRAEPATADLKRRALAWLAALRAGGGTEMVDGIRAALGGLRAEAQRQVVVITDGLIGFEQEVVSAIARELPRGSRVHALGVGSSTNRTLLAGVARVGAGIEVIVGLGEDPERAARRLLARTADPVVVDLEIEGDAVAERAPARLPDLFAGAPVRVALRLRPEGGAVVVRGRTTAGGWERTLQVPSAGATRPGDVPSRLFARERAADLETELSAGRPRAEVDADLLALGLRHAIATRLTSWVAADDARSVDPTAPTRREVVPQQLPHGMSAAGLGLRPAAAPPPVTMAMAMMPRSAPMPAVLHVPRPPMGAAPPMPARAASRPPMAPPPPPPGMAAPPPPPAAIADAFDDEEDAGAIASEETPLHRGLVGRVVSRDGTSLVVEVTLEQGDLDWSPGDVRCLLVDERGAEHGAALDLARTTRAGRHARGLTLRIAVLRPRGVTSIAAVRLDLSGAPLYIALRG